MLGTSFLKDRRTEPRTSQDAAVMLFKEGRLAGYARLHDLSASGARLLGPAEAVAAADVFVISGRPEAISYTVVRSGFGGVGVSITGRRSLKGRLSGELERIRRASQGF